MRVLTKSRFKLGLECPNKLYYTRKDEYANQKNEDTFLKALAAGGFQVEELARMMHTGGILIDGERSDYEALWRETKQLLTQENITIYEAAFLHEHLFIRTDILVKKGNHVKLIEVKSKSYDPNDDYIFVGKRGELDSKWKPYLYDVAFQKYVMQSCFPEWKISSYMMMADKTKKATVNGLNQMFRITRKAGNRTGIVKLENDINNLGKPILRSENIDDIVEGIENGKHKALDQRSFEETIAYLKEHYVKDKKTSWTPHFSACKKCEFKASQEDLDQGKKSGFEECFKIHYHWSTTHFSKAMLFNIWDFRRGDSMFGQSKFFMEELTEDDIGYDPEKVHSTISRTERQWIQICKEVEGDSTTYVLKDELKEEMEKWIFPLHFIDFETNTAALPFHVNRSPYEQIAFQFSHHIYQENGTIDHANEYINCTPGEFPNFHFIRALKTALDNDNGTIFMFSPHENTVLNKIYYQLLNSDEDDKVELMGFIQSISRSSDKSAVKWNSSRAMVDLRKVVVDYYYNPYTKGSNSLKMILPAILHSDTGLQRKYAHAIGDIGISSKNFDSTHRWLSIQNGKVKNPYKLLPPIFEEWLDEMVEDTISELDDVADGGAAMMAYSKMQYMDMTQREREEIKTALLRYCELDTLAMVMLYEHFVASCK